MAAKKKRTKPKIRVAHELPKRRKSLIQEAMAAHKLEDRPEWDRTAEWGPTRFYRKTIKPGTMRTINLPLLEIELGDSWPIPVTIIHGTRPGPTITVLGGMHGDELTGPATCTHLLSNIFTEDGKPLDPIQMAGTLRIVPIVNLPGYRAKSRYFPDGRDLNRNFPGDFKGSTTKRVAAQVWKYLFSDADAIVDLHSAGKGRANMPQLRADLAHAGSNILAKAFGIEIILDSKPPSGSLRKHAIRNDIPVVTYEGGGANLLDHESVKVAIHGVLNVLRSLRMIPGNPHRPRFRMLASGSHWLRAGEGGLLDMFVSAGSVMREGDVIATISDPANPGFTVDIVAPEDGLLIGAASNPFTAAGMPVGHFLPVSKHIALLEDQINSNGRFLVCGSQSDPVWREEVDVDEIAVDGDWNGGLIDSEWNENKEGGNAAGDTFNDEEEEEAEA
tara:strand:- start:6095 stop:7429 length:1335 start_codon:yes stop_codon:yes gene_type:complete